MNSGPNPRQFRDHVISIFQSSGLDDFGVYVDVALAGKVLGALEIAGLFQNDTIDNIRDGSFIHWKSYLFEVAASAVLEEDGKLWTDRMLPFGIVVQTLKLLSDLYKHQLVDASIIA